MGRIYRSEPQEPDDDYGTHIVPALATLIALVICVAFVWWVLWMVAQ